jgi:hypothetical protein
MRDRTDPDAWRRAREIASQHPLRGPTGAEAVRAIVDVMASIGDNCPDSNDYLSKRSPAKLNKSKHPGND